MGFTAQWEHRAEFPKNMEFPDVEFPYVECGVPKGDAPCCESSLLIYRNPRLTVLLFQTVGQNERPRHHVAANPKIRRAELHKHE